eukprot:TRINITY_DN17309_c0_g1_i1.p1 TRINITY_DN17309_c0_g1~~TRINITY_DN17309_c0_g1_i1.p1  ORF type:complete len:332 (+),score=41.90 TRINITY_DN17309_c0_g1_i1:84-1079(+)
MEAQPRSTGCGGQCSRLIWTGALLVAGTAAHLGAAAYGRKGAVSAKHPQKGNATEATERGRAAPGWVTWEMREPTYGCRYLYLDLGAGHGLQLRKLFEPGRFPDMDPVTAGLFDNLAGRALPDGRRPEPAATCAIAFEANYTYSRDLMRLEDIYLTKGMRIHAREETLLAAAEGFSTWEGRPIVTASLPRFIADHVAARAVLPGRRPPATATHFPATFGAGGYQWDALSALLGAPPAGGLPLLCWLGHVHAVWNFSAAPRNARQLVAELAQRGNSACPPGTFSVTEHLDVSYADNSSWMDDLKLSVVPMSVRPQADLPVGKKRRRARHSLR